MTLNPVLADLYSAIEIWSNAWSKNRFDEKKDDTPLGEVLEWGLIPYTSPFGINWFSPDDPVDEGEVWQEHYETQEMMLQALSDAVKEDILLNPDNMVILVDLNSDYNNEGDLASLIFSDKDGRFFYGSRFESLKRFNESNKDIGASRTFYNKLKRATLVDNFPKKEWKPIYEEWAGWLDSAGDFYGNYSDLIRDCLSFTFDTEAPEEMMNLQDNDKHEFRKVWIVVKKSKILPVMINWNRDSAQGLWNLLSR